MISHRCRYKARGSVLMRVFTSSSVRWVAARVTLAISSLFSFQSSPPLFYHSTRISMRCYSERASLQGLSTGSFEAGPLAPSLPAHVPELEPSLSQLPQPDPP